MTDIRRAMNSVRLTRLPKEQPNLAIPNKQNTSEGQVPEQVQDKYRTSTGQVQDKYRTSTGQVQDMFHTDNPNIVKLVHVVGYNELSVKGMMEGVGLKGRDNFLNLYLTPAITAGYIRLLFPNSPRHPRQRYLLTAKGLSLYNEIKGD